MAVTTLGNVRGVTDIRQTQGHSDQELATPVDYSSTSKLRAALQLAELTANTLTTVSSDGETDKHFNATDGSVLADGKVDIYEVGTVTKRATVTITNISTNDITYSENDVDFVAGDIIVANGWALSAYTNKNLDLMTVNDMVYALRLYNDAAGI